MKHLRKVVKQINQVFVNFVLIIFYFLGLGLAFLIYRLTKKKEKNQVSYWNKEVTQQFSSDYFQSAY
jgi:hypothetical protein